MTSGWKTTPYWWDDAPVMPLTVPDLPRNPDVIVVGAGYAGLAAALTLVRAGRSVLVLDRMNPGEGASSRNGGMTSGNIRLSFAQASRKYGEARALAIEAEGAAARAFIYDFIRDEGLRCDFQKTGRFHGAIGAGDYEEMARGAEALDRRLGIESYAVPYAEQQRYLGTDAYRGGVVRMDIGGLHPAKYHAEILRVAQAAGVVVAGHSAVTAILREGAGFCVSVAQPQGRFELRAGRVLVCTNGYTDKALPYLNRRIVPVRSRMIATDPLPPALMAELMPKGMMCGENKILGYYYRPSPDGTRILLGGRDSVMTRDDPASARALLAGLVEIFPQLRGVGLSHSWYGNVAMHRDLLPRIFERDGITYATGFCGSGVVWAPWIGTRAAHKLLGDRDKTSAFDFRPPPAVPLYAGKPYFMPPLIHAYRVLDRIALARAKR